MSPRRRALLCLCLLVPLPVGIAACGSDDDALTIYSGRQEALVGDLIEQFEDESGVDVEVRYGDSAALAATIGEEGDASPADVAFLQDAGALGAIEQQLAPLSRRELAQVPERFRDPRGRWVGTSGRARVLAYSPERVRGNELPDSVLDMTNERWKGKLGFAPTNASFQAFVSALRLDIGDERAKEFLEQLEANDPKRYENNIETVKAIDRGEIDAGLVNHYYLYELKAEDEDLAVDNHYFKSGDPGALVNVAGVGILATADHKEDAAKFVNFLLSIKGQQYFSEETFEYPLIPGVSPPQGVKPLDAVEGPDIELGRLGEQLRSTRELIDSTGLNSAG